MKVIMQTVYQTADGLDFDDEDKATEHEARVLRDAPEAIIARKPPEAFLDAIKGDDPTLADAIERVAYLVARARRERGDLRRRPRPAAKDEDDHGGGFDGPTGAD